MQIVGFPIGRLILFPDEGPCLQFISLQRMVCLKPCASSDSWENVLYVQVPKNIGIDYILTFHFIDIIHVQKYEG